MQVICGDCVTVLEQSLPKESIDTVYTTPSPFRYYKEDAYPGQNNKIGSEQSFEDYIKNLLKMFDKCWDVLKPSGNLFAQIPEMFNVDGGIVGVPVIFENHMRNRGTWFLRNRLFWHRTEVGNRKIKYEEKGFLKNYEYIFNFVKDKENFYFNEKSRYAKTSIFSYPLEDSYYTNEFDSGLPEDLTKMVIDTTVPQNNGIILDPLAGTGKVGVVAKKMNRNAILIDIDFETCKLMRIRLGLDK